MGGRTAMRFFGIITLTIALLQREGRITLSGAQARL